MSGMKDRIKDRIEMQNILWGLMLVIILACLSSALLVEATDKQEVEVNSDEIYTYAEAEKCELWFSMRKLGMCMMERYEVTRKLKRKLRICEYSLKEGLK